MWTFLQRFNKIPWKKKGEYINRIVYLFRTNITFHPNTPPIGPLQGWLSSALLTATWWHPSWTIVQVSGSSVIFLLVLQWELKRVSLYVEFSVEFSVEHLYFLSRNRFQTNGTWMNVIFVSTQLTKDIWHYLINIFGYTAPIWL